MSQKYLQLADQKCSPLFIHLRMPTDSSLSFILMSMYEMMGNTISLQYGGSEAHSVFFDRKKGEWEATTQSKVISRQTMDLGQRPLMPNPKCIFSHYLPRECT